MFNITPDATKLSEIFSHAIAPTFFLGAIAGFISLMASRLSAVMQRVQTLNAIAENDPARAHLKGDLARLKRRARNLNGRILASMYGCLCATRRPAILFAAAFCG